MAKRPTHRQAPPVAPQPAPEVIPEQEDAPEPEPEEIGPEPLDDDPEIARLIAEDEAAASAAGERDEPDTRELADAIKILREQAATLDLTVDPEWDADTLAAKVLEAQEAKAEAERAVFDAAAKEKVFLLRDAWPVADEKHFAGETIEVPRDIAVKWYVAGVARPA